MSLKRIKSQSEHYAVEWIREREREKTGVSAFFLLL